MATTSILTEARDDTAEELEEIFQEHRTSQWKLIHSVHEKHPLEPTPVTIG